MGHATVSKTVRVIVVNTDEEAAAELRALLLSVDGVKIVAEVDEPFLLAQALNQFPAEVLLLHLDPNPAAMMAAAAPLIGAHKEQLAAIAMTENRDAELVVQAMRAGMREFLWKPFPREQLAEVLHRIGRETPSTGRGAGRLIPVVGCCGGVGVTFVAINLAVELAQLDGWVDGDGRPKVAVVDLDFRYGQVAMFLDTQPTYTIAELCETPEHIEPQMLDRVMVKHASGVHVLAHPNDLEQAERISAANCAGVLATLLEHYDFVITDGPVRFDPSARAVFDMTDMYLLVLQLLVPPVRNADRLLHELRRAGYNLDKLHLVCNRLGREAAFLEPADVETTLSRKISWALPDDWRTASTAINVGSPLLECAPKSKLRAAFAHMAREIANRSMDPSAAGKAKAAGESQKKSLLSILGG
jgi:pilus assembly protein CpaE